MEYANIVFMQGDEAIEPLDILNEHGEIAAIEYLAQWDMGEYHERQEFSASGTDDHNFIADHYLLTWNSKISYIGLEKIICDNFPHCDRKLFWRGLISTNKEIDHI